MTDPPLIYDPPRFAMVRRVRHALTLAALFNLVALVLLPLHYTPAAHVFVGLAFVACVVGLFFASRSAGPGSQAQTPTQKPPAPTASR